MPPGTTGARTSSTWSTRWRDPGATDQEVATRREEELHSKIKAFFPCNILVDRAEDILDGGAYS